MSGQEVELIRDVGSFTYDPLSFVRYAFPWGEGSLSGFSGPDAWQVDVLKYIGDELRKGGKLGAVVRVAVASGHGIGKSALVSWIVLWAMATCPDTKGVVTANTDTQLRTKTGAEIAKWYQLCLCKHWFKSSATSVASADAGHERTWRVDLIPWSVSNTESFAGMHNKGKRILVVFDEASAIDDKIWEVTEGALTDAETEIVWVCFGNPTRNTGRFRECFRKFRHRWQCWHIDSRTTAMANKKLLDEWVNDYGEDSDFVKVRVRGMFPNASAKQFIPTDVVDAAIKRHLHDGQYQFAPAIISCDPAWEGDDELVIAMRQGLFFRILRKIRTNSNDLQVAQLIAQYEDEFKAAAVFVDGGFGTGIISAGRTMNRNWTVVWFSEKPADEGCLNKRAEMWKLMRDWLRDGGVIPDDPTLYQDLLGPETVPRMDGKIQLESKDMMKRRGQPSPNCADALALTFAYPVFQSDSRMQQDRVEYNPAEVAWG